MTRQRWWKTRALSRIRLGVETGRYYAGTSFARHYRVLLEATDRDSLSLYERGLLAGYRSVSVREPRVQR